MLYSFDPLELAVGAFGEVLSSIDADPIFPSHLAGLHTRKAPVARGFSFARGGARLVFGSQ